MILYQTINCPIIHVYMQEILNEIFEHSDNHSRKDCWRILQPKRRDCILKTTPFSEKHGIMVILLCNSDPVVSQKAIFEEIQLLTTYSFKDLICKWSQERIMHACKHHSTLLGRRKCGLRHSFYPEPP